MPRPASPFSAISKPAAFMSASEHLGQSPPQLSQQQLARVTSDPTGLLVGPGVPVSGDKIAAMQTANEELRARNHALLQRSINQEEELWRVKSAARALHPSEHVAAYPRRADDAQTAASVVAGSGDAVTGTLWQFMDIAVTNCVRARADVRRAHAESLIQLDKAFNPQEREARLRARGIVAQITRASAKMQAACQQLESEAQAAKLAHEADVAAWTARLRKALTRMTAQQEALATTLLLELDQSERTYAHHTRTLRQTQEALEVQRAQEHGRSREEAESLAMQLAKLQHDADEGRTQSSHREKALVADGTALRARIAKLEAALQEERDERAAEQQTHEHLVAELQATNAKLRAAMGEGAVQSQLQVEQLQGQLAALEHHHDVTTSELNKQIGMVSQLKEEQAAELRDALERSHVEKHAQAAMLTDQIKALREDRAADANHLHAKIERLRSLHTAALAAGSVRGRQLLYQESLKSPNLLRQSSTSWRGEDWRPISPRSPQHSTPSLRGPTPRGRRAPSPGSMAIESP